MKNSQTYSMWSKIHVCSFLHILNSYFNIIEEEDEEEEHKVHYLMTTSCICVREHSRKNFLESAFLEWEEEHEKSEKIHASRWASRYIPLAFPTNLHLRLLQQLARHFKCVFI